MRRSRQARASLVLRGVLRGVLRDLLAVLAVLAAAVGGAAAKGAPRLQDWAGRGGTGAAAAAWAAAALTSAEPEVSTTWAGVDDVLRLGRSLMYALAHALALTRALAHALALALAHALALALALALAHALAHALALALALALNHALNRTHALAHALARTPVPRSPATGWSQPQRLLELLWPVQGDLQPWTPYSVARAAYAIAVVPCPDPETWWACPDFRLRHNGAIADFGALAAHLGQRHASLPLLLAVFSGRLLRSVDLRGSPGRGSTVVDGGSGNALPRGSPRHHRRRTPDPPTVWLHIPAPLLVPPSPGVAPGVYSHDLPMSPWFEQLLATVETDVASVLRRQLLSPLEGLKATTMRTRAGDVYFVKVHAITASASNAGGTGADAVGTILHVRLLCPETPPCALTAVLRGGLNVNSPLRYFNVAGTRSAL